MEAERTEYNIVMYCDKNLDTRLIQYSNFPNIPDHSIIDNQLSIAELIVGNLYVCTKIYVINNRFVADDVIEYSEDLTLSPDCADVLDANLGVNVSFGVPNKEKSKSAKKTKLERIVGSKFYKPPSLLKDGFFIDEKIWYFLIWSALRKNQVLLVGDAGTGKTTVPTFVMNAVNKRRVSVGRESLPISYFDMFTVNPESEFKGSLRVINKKTYFQYSRFSRVIQRGGMSVLNELNRGNKHTQNIMLSVLDEQRVLHIEKADEMQNIKVDDEHVFFATANIGNKYSGTTSIDPAVARRFDYIELSHPPKKEEAEVLVRRTGITKRESYLIVEIATAIRESDSIDVKASTADLLKVADKVSSGYSIVGAFEFTILGRYEGNSIDGGEKAQVRAIINSK